MKRWIDSGLPATSVRQGGRSIRLSPLNGDANLFAVSPELRLPGVEIHGSFRVFAKELKRTWIFRLEVAKEMGY